MISTFDPQLVRPQFPALTRTHRGQPVTYFDGPAGSQVPQSVIDAVARCLRDTNANRGAPFATSRAVDELMDRAHRAVADLLGTGDPQTIVFGANMTTLTLALSRALGRNWQPGDEIIVSRLDHDANVTPWTLAAREAGALVRHIDIHLEDCTLRWESFEKALTERTKLVAVGYASNSVGTINPVRKICHAARQVGALTFIDAVHFAPHGLIDVADLHCDYLICSAYKFFGPHVGILWGRHDLLEKFTPYKLRPSPDTIPDRWMTGTQNHEGIAGVTAAIDYLADIGRQVSAEQYMASRRSHLEAAFRAIQDYERELASRLLDGLEALPGVHIWGIVNRDRLTDRVPTVSITHQTMRPQQLAERLAHEGLYVWPGNHYALPFTEAAGLEPDGTLRIGLLHYNTADEVDRLLQVLTHLLAPSR